MDSLPPVALSPREPERPPTQRGRRRAQVLRIAIVILPLVLGISQANASLYVLPSADEDATLARRADIVPIGTTTAAESFWRGGQIFSRVTFHVRDTIAGKPAAGPDITVETRGGHRDGIGMAVSTSPRFEPGEEAVLFLRRASSGQEAERYVVLGGERGKRALARDDAGREIVISQRPEDGHVQIEPLSAFANRVTSARTP